MELEDAIVIVKRLSDGATPATAGFDQAEFAALDAVLSAAEHWKALKWGHAVLRGEVRP